MGVAGDKPAWLGESWSGPAIPSLLSGTGCRPCVLGAPVEVSPWAARFLTGGGSSQPPLGCSHGPGLGRAGLSVWASHRGKEPCLEDPETLRAARNGKFGPPPLLGRHSSSAIGFCCFNTKEPFPLPLAWPAPCFNPYPRHVPTTPFPGPSRLSMQGSPGSKSAEPQACMALLSLPLPALKLRNGGRESWGIDSFIPVPSPGRPLSQFSPRGSWPSYTEKTA